MNENKFKSLKDRMLYNRNITDYRLVPNSYVIIMLDGRGFSHSIKKYFNKPFDDTFINMMNETALYLCNSIQGCKFGYVQSDEISLVITDFDKEDSDSFFEYRIQKICSICASLATSKFNQLMSIEELKRNPSEDPEKVINNMKTYEFDCKAWNASRYKDVFTWFLYRQIDCIRNSKQQAARAYMSHSECNKKNTDELCSMLNQNHNIDWENEYNDGIKYGRFIYKDEVTFKSEQYGEFKRNKFAVHNAFILTDENGPKNFEKVSKIPRNK